MWTLAYVAFLLALFASARADEARAAALARAAGRGGGAAGASDFSLTEATVAVFGGTGGEEAAGSSDDDLLEKIIAAMGSGDDTDLFRQRAAKHLPDVRMSLAPILAALPRNAKRKFDRSAVRYALHHYFLRSYAWRLQGLDPVASLWNSSSPSAAEVLRRLPVGVRSAIEVRLNSSGLDVDGVAALAVTLWRLIHGEGTNRLRLVYRLLGTPEHEPISEQDAKLVVDMYMAAYITGQDLAKANQKRMMRLYDHMYKITPKWREVQAFTGDILKSESVRSATPGFFEFPDVANVVEAIEERFGHWQMTECNEFKQVLAPMEDQGTGRVRIGDFYKAGLGTQWQFSESVDYLRELGALDETSSGNQRVIIVNYITGASNCFGTTKYHEVCCISECEGLLAHLERQFAAPSVSPEDIATFVAAMPSSTVPAPRTLSNVLLHRLQVIAASNGGLVPLAGRLFAQWMHHAYPRECPYPHPANTTKPMNPFAWKASGANVTSKKEMQELAGRPHRQQEPVQMAPWVAKEELPASYMASDPRPPTYWAPVQFVVALASFSVVLFRLARLACRALLTGGSRTPRKAGESWRAHFAV